MSDSSCSPPLHTHNGKHLGIIGLGLIGGSLALAAKRAGWRITAYNRSGNITRAAVDSGKIDAAVDNISELGGCDIIFLAVPMNTYDTALAQLAPALSQSGIITDGGSTKQAAAAAARRQLGDHYRRFVPAHPIAGKEQSGWQAANADLFTNRLVILCKDDCDDDAYDAVNALWRQTGARTHTMAAAAHDRHLALVSHLPHLLSYALVSAIDKQPDSEELLQFAAGGFRDFTRIAASHPDMWRDICMTNTHNILEMIELYQQELAQFADFIKTRNGEKLSARMSAARRLRQQWKNILEQ